MPYPSGLPVLVQTGACLDQQPALKTGERKREREKPQSPTSAALHFTATGWQQRATPLRQQQKLEGQPPRPRRPPGSGVGGGGL